MTRFCAYALNSGSSTMWCLCSMVSVTLIDHVLVFFKDHVAKNT